MFDLLYAVNDIICGAFLVHTQSVECSYSMAGALIDARVSLGLVI